MRGFTRVGLHVVLGLMLGVGLGLVVRTVMHRPYQPIPQSFMVTP